MGRHHQPIRKQLDRRLKKLAVQQWGWCAEIVRNLQIRASVEALVLSIPVKEVDGPSVSDVSSRNWICSAGRLTDLSVRPPVIACVERTVEFKLVDKFEALADVLRTSTVVSEQSSTSRNQQRVKNRQSSEIYCTTWSRHQFIFDYSSKHCKFLLCYKLLLNYYKSARLS